MPRPMTTYRSGLVTRTVWRAYVCIGCAGTFRESRRFTDLLPEQVEAWQAERPQHCRKCAARKARTAAGSR